MNSSEAATTSIHQAENVLYPLIAGIGIFANAVVIIVVVIWEKLQTHRTIANMFVVNLAIADLLFLVVLPLQMPSLIDRGWVFGKFLCKFTEGIKYINFRASICFLTIMTLDRFFAIVYSLESRPYRIRRNGFRICLIVWLLSACLTIPIFIYANVYDENIARCQVQFPGYESPFAAEDSLYEELYSSIYNSGEADNYTEMEGLGSAFDGSIASPTGPYICLDEGHKDSSAHIAWVCTNFITFFVVPTITILYCYGRIIQVTISRDVQSTVANGVNSQLVKMVALLVSAFLICWLPFQVFEILILPPGRQVHGKNDCMILKTTFSILAWTYSTINPFLYSFSSGRFRHKVVVAWTFIVHGRTRVLKKQTSQRTMLTRINTATSGSTKSLNASSLATKNQAITQPVTNESDVQSKEKPSCI